MKKINLTIIITLSFLVLFLFGCKAIEVPMADDTGATPEGARALANSNNQFALDLYAKLNQEEGNVFFSPWSITTALGMTYEGARGKTAEEMADVFYFTQPDAERRSSFARIHNLINQKNKDYQLHTANALWADHNYGFLPEYINTVGKYYGGNVNNVDFQSQPEEARQKINDWVEYMTNNKIKDLFAPGTIHNMVRLVLTNAVYFKGTWVKEFDKGKTRDEPFYTTPNNPVQVPMMQLKGDEAIFNYAETENLQMLEMKYKGDKLSMLVLLPKGDLSSLESKLTAENLNNWKGALREQEVDVYLPKFKFESKYKLNQQLAALGMPTAFSMDADFSGMDGSKMLFIELVVHQAYVDVNEEGTEAAAATGVVMTLKAMPNKPTFRADHPFIFIIQDKDTGNILFMGKVVNPAEE